MAVKKVAKKAVKKTAKKAVKKAPTRKAAKKVAKKAVRKTAKKRAKVSTLTKLERALFARMVELDELAADAGLAGAVESSGNGNKRRRTPRRKRS
jgi:hypothetical protein